MVGNGNLENFLYVFKRVGDTWLKYSFSMRSFKDPLPNIA